MDTIASPRTYEASLYSVGGNLLAADEILKIGGLDKRILPKLLTPEQTEKLLEGMQQAKIMKPSMDCLSPIGDELLTDLNCDGEVNIFDVSLAASALGTKIGDPMWKVEADVNLDGAVNIYDISSIAKDFGRRVVISPT